MREMVAPEFRHEFDAYLNRIECEGEARGLLVVVTKSGERRIWEYSNTLKRDGSEKPFVSGIARDVTKQKRTEEMLRQANEALVHKVNEGDGVIRELKLFRTLVDRSNDAVLVVDPHTLHLLDANERACEQLGYSRDELLSIGVPGIDPGSKELVRNKCVSEFEKSGFVATESVHRRKDGTTFPVELRITRVRLDRDYAVTIARDLTERKEAEGRLREYERVVEGLEEVIAVVDREYRYVIANRAFLESRGLRKEEVIGHRVSEIIGAAVFESVVQQKMDECFQGKMVQYDLTLDFPVLGKRSLFATYFPIEGPARVDRIAMILQDVTHRKRSDEAVRRSEENYRNFVSQSSEGIFRQDLDAPVATDIPEEELIQHIQHDHYMAECNDAMAAMYGVKSGKELVANA